MPGLLRLTVVCLLAGAVTGCSLFQESFRVDPALTRANISTSKGLGLGTKYLPVNLDEFRFKGGQTLIEKNYEVTEVERNLLVDLVRERSDLICAAHLADAFGTATSVNFTGSLLATMFSGAAAAVTGGAAQTALSGASTFASGTTALFNSKVYQDLFIGAIISAIEDDRAKKLSDIEAKKTRSAGNYSVMGALADVQDYHNRCSFYHGLVLLKEAVEKQKDTRAGLLDQIDRLQREIDSNGTAMAKAKADGSASSERHYQEIIAELTRQKLQLYQRLGQTRAPAGG